MRLPTPLAERPRTCPRRAAVQPVRSVVLLGALLALLGLPEPAQAQTPEAESFIRVSLPLAQELGDVLAADLNGDGRRDLVVIEVDRSTRANLASLSVFLSEGEGYRPVSSAREQLPRGLALAALGTFGGKPQLALLMPGRLELWPWRGERFVPWEGQRLEQDSVFLEPDGDLKNAIPWMDDLNGDGENELLVPLFDGGEIVGVDPSGALKPMAHLRTYPHGRIMNWFRRSLIGYQLPQAEVLDANRDGTRDLVFYNDGILQVFLNQTLSKGGTLRPDLEMDLQPPQPFDPNKPWDPPLRLVDSEDLNGDGYFDLVFTKNSEADSGFNTRTRVLIHYGKPAKTPAGVRFSEQPDQIYESEGFSLPFLLDLNKDQRKDMVLVNVEIGFWTAIKALIARSVSAQAAFYLMPEAGQYSRQPDELVSYSVSFTLGRFTHQPISQFGDLNGDGRPDLMLSVSKDELGIHWGQPGEPWSSDPNTTVKDFLPIRSERVVVRDLNGDGRDDLLFAYNRDDIRQMPPVLNTITVLLSRAPGKVATR